MLKILSDDGCHVPACFTMYPGDMVLIYIKVNLIRLVCCWRCVQGRVELVPDTWIGWRWLLRSRGKQLQSWNGLNDDITLNWMWNRSVWPLLVPRSSSWLPAPRMSWERRAVAFVNWHPLSRSDLDSLRAPSSSMPKRLPPVVSAPLPKLSLSATNSSVVWLCEGKVLKTNFCWICV